MSGYDPYHRDEEQERERAGAARYEHQAWSLEQARANNSAAQRESTGVWVKRVTDDIGRS